MSVRTSWCFAAAIVIAASCGGKPKTASNPNATKAVPVASTDTTEAMLIIDPNAPPGLKMQLSEGTAIGGRLPQLKVPPAQKLSGSLADKILARLPALKKKDGDVKSFAFRERSLPPPRTGKTIKGQFPPPLQKGPPAVPRGQKLPPLKIVRHAPEGDVPIVPHLSVTFSQPMVAITSHDDSIARGVPVKLSPQPKGNWRWIGTKTLLFDPDVRFPMATTYKVEVPAGTTSTVDGKLKQGKSWTFTTPPPTPQVMHPQHGPQHLDVVMFIAFDQRIDRDAVLRNITVHAGRHSYKVRAATSAEIEADDVVENLIEGQRKAEHEGRWVAFRVDQDLPKDTSIRVVVNKGTPSAEGPNRTDKDQGYTFQTYPPLKVVEARCSWGGNCPPMTPWYIRFNNPIDEDQFDAERIAIDPELPSRKIDLYSNYMNIRGLSRGRTTYDVTLPANLTDKFGQTLGEDETLTFKVGSAEPTLTGPSGLVVLDPAAGPRFSVYSINHKELRVRAYKVGPKDWPKFTKYMRDFYRRRKMPSPPGKRVFNTTVNVEDFEKDVLSETVIDLKKALPKGLGHVVVTVEPPNQPRDPWRRQIVHGWYQATKIGLDGFVDSTDLFAWATSLHDGKPLQGVSLELWPNNIKQTSDARGLGTLALPKKPKKGMQMLVARQGDDVAILPENNYWWGDYTGWQYRETNDTLRWFTFDDRKMYRPGETVHVKGWIRRIDNGERGDLVPLRGAADKVSYVITGSRGNEIKKGSLAVNAAGGFDFEFELPKTPNLGHAYISFTAVGKGGTIGGRVHNHSFQIQEFRRPEFEVNASADSGPHLLGGSADVKVDASYYAGGGLPNAQVTWNVSAYAGSFTPPNRDKFTFGTWIPWWSYRYENVPSSYEYLQGKTDATGAHHLEIDFLSMNPPRPMAVTAQATVMDVNRQAWSSAANMIVHPADIYVGLRSEKYFVERGEPLEVHAIAVDLDGKAVLDRDMRLRAVRVDHRYKQGKWIEEEEDPQECALKSQKDAVSCEFDTKEGGRYKVTAFVKDDRGRPNRSELTLWVSGGDLPPARNVEQELIQIIPDKEEYAPGDTAKLLVQTPFYPAHALVTYRRAGIFHTERMMLKSATQTLAVPIEDSYTPNLYVQVDVVGAATRLNDDGEPNDKLPKRPAFGKGAINLSIPPSQRSLKVKVAPKHDKLEPGGKTSLDIDVRDANGKPVSGAELAVVVVDESVLALSGFQMPDPVDIFYYQRGPGAQDHHLRAYVSLAKPEAESFAGNSGTGSGYGRGGGGGGGDADAVMDVADEAEVTAGALAPPAEPSPAPVAQTRTVSKKKSPAKPARNKDRGKREGKSDGNYREDNTPIALRTNFNALAHFAPEVKTNASGRARVPIKVPDNLTRYRVMVVAVSGERYFGKGESAITARMPLMVRPSPPRFLNFGDTFELPVVVQNQTDEQMNVQVAVRTTNARLTDGSGRSVIVPPNDRVEVRFPTAAGKPGTARFQIAATTKGSSDASEFSLPIWTPATTEAFATYGEIDKGAIRQPVAMPPDVVTEFGGLEITTSSTQLQALTDAFLYIVAYPYECSEQVSSRVLAIAALRDVLTAFEAEGLPSKDALEERVAADVKLLKMLQNYDGGFAFWRQGDRSWPYISIHVAHALVRAKEKGFDVPKQMLDRSQQYLRNIKNHIPHWYSPQIKRVLRAYALYVRTLMNDGDPKKGRALIAEAGLEGLSMEAIGWVLFSISGDKSSKTDIKKIHRYLTNKVTETAAAANFSTSYADGAYLILHSSRRADAVILEAMIKDTPKSDLIPKIVRGLLAHRKRGRWSNTQENAFVLLSMDKYFHTYEKVTPDFVAQAWLGDNFAGEHKFKGRQTDRYHIGVPMGFLAKMKGDQDLILNKKGKGRMYYRVGMTYAPKSLKLEPADHGFAVVRQYEPVDDPKDVTRGKDGTWHIKAGARVRVRLTMAAQNRRYHVALVDPLPAGLEPMNPALAVTGEIPQDPGAQKGGPRGGSKHRYWWWWRTWYEHQNMRDERVEAFTSLLWAGVHEYTYVARATTPGNFVVPPTKAEEMYFPETFGRSASDRVIVK